MVALRDRVTLSHLGRTCRGKAASYLDGGAGGAGFEHEGFDAHSESESAWPRVLVDDSASRGRGGGGGGGGSGGGSPVRDPFDDNSLVGRCPVLKKGNGTANPRAGKKAAGRRGLKITDKKGKRAVGAGRSPTGRCDTSLPGWCTCFLRRRSK